MRRMRICEEKGSGVDKVVQAAEVFQLPAPLFHTGSKRVHVRVLAQRTSRTWIAAIASQPAAALRPPLGDGRAHDEPVAPRTVPPP